MQAFIDLPPARRHTYGLLLLILLLGANARADDFLRMGGGARDLAFARYVTSQQQRDPVAAQAGPVGVLIEASLPELYKSAAVLAVNMAGESARGALQVLRAMGDGTVAEEVIDCYLTLRRQIDDLPFSSIAVTPENYKFRFAGEVKTGASSAYIYDVTPRKNRPGMLVGQLWMDSRTGQEIMLKGLLLPMSSTGGRVDFVRDTSLMSGSSWTRATHMSFTLPRLGRAELLITEAVLPQAMVSGIQ
jgi:hypothetical protein